MIRRVLAFAVVVCALAACSSSDSDDAPPVPEIKLVQSLSSPDYDVKNSPADMATDAEHVVLGTVEKWVKVDPGVTSGFPSATAHVRVDETLKGDKAPQATISVELMFFHTPLTELGRLKDDVTTATLDKAVPPGSQVLVAGSKSRSFDTDVVPLLQGFFIRMPDGDYAVAGGEAAQVALKQWPQSETYKGSREGGNFAALLRDVRG
jgi:hypothetical protein